MSFFSKSSKNSHYKNGTYGSGHYQKKGLLGGLFDMLASRSHSGGFYNDGRNQNNNIPMQNQHFSNQGSKNCSKCNSQIPAGSKFCLNCGEQVKTEIFCLNCGEKMPPNAKFCNNCGNKLNG